MITYNILSDIILNLPEESKSEDLEIKIVHGEIVKKIEDIKIEKGVILIEIE